MTAPLPQDPVAITAPLAPLFKADVARTLGVSTRTIEMWATQGLMPAPARIGGRVYWHPATFYAWLDKRLRVPDRSCDDATPQDRPPPPTTTDVGAAAHGADEKRANKKKSKEAVTSLAGERAMRRSSAMLRALNAAC